MHFPRRGGILLHITALPGPYGIGTLGANALNFLDWLQAAGMSYWQICPLGPTGYGDSPYQSFSAFAGNPNLIDLNNLVGLGLLDKADLLPLENLPDSHVDFGRIIPLKAAVLRSAWQRFQRMGRLSKLSRNFRQFTAAEDWLDDYSLFMAARESQNGAPWNQWPRPLRFREASALKELRSAQKDEANYQCFIQFLFHQQWQELKKEASARGIGIIGDLPIFVSFDSADSWSHPELFQLDAERNPTHAAGVPPDYFSTTGQLWGNPLYNWQAMEQNGFEWWLAILKNKLELYDALRIDHFRGFAACWAVPGGEKTAENGFWQPSLGHELFQKVKAVMGDVPLIAEDLGVITDDVRALIDEFGFPGMKVLQFAFDSSEENNYLPHNYPHHCVVYTGTHDNDTTAGWYETASEHDKSAMRAYLNLPDGIDRKQAAAAIVEAAYKSIADLAIVPVQDILGLGKEARFNTPGVAGGNWTWRLPADALRAEISGRLLELMRVHKRLGGKT
ncbi:MAG: 4-alpha-glucanotransferase [Spirochaeta sp. LUC14_002_19_P3]|nr:MAG: 4-alpha-glucanotransferase [Spirochaeta sp. LUC14_002_19_P3]